MIKTNYDAEHDVLILEFEGNVDAAEARRSYSNIEEVLPQGKVGFRLLIDFSSVETLEPEVEGEMKKAMDFFNARGVSEILRVLPDPDLEIGFDMIARAHYSAGVRIHTFRTREAAQSFLGESEKIMNRFEGKVVIVTGAGSGIGAGTARRFLREGAFVVLNGRREHKLRETLAGTDAAKSLIHSGDVSDEAYVKRLVEDAVAKFGKLDVLVNNAATAIFGPFVKTTTEDWRKVMSTDLDGVYFTSREALPHLLKTKGSIINLSSASGLGGDWGMSAYNAAKGAVTNFTRALALEYGSRGVRINAVAPSLTSSEATAELVKNEALMAAFVDRLPIGRAATPEDIAGVIAFLASEDAVFINGVILPVDGGLHASNGQPNFLSLMG